MRLRRRSAAQPVSAGSSHDRHSAVVARGYDPLATEDDILACFRLLMGRNINDEERAGHLGMVGQPLDSVLPIYLHSIEFRARDLLEPVADRDVLLAETHDFSIFASPNDGVGRQVIAGVYEPHVAAFIRDSLAPGDHAVDIGANIGYFTMIMARAVGPSGSVLAIEPNPSNARLIEASRRVNRFENVKIAQVAAGRSTGLLVLNAGQSNGTTSALREEVRAVLDAPTVPSIPVAALADERPVRLIKIDVEGAEYNALLGAQAVLVADRPTIVSEYSPGQLVGISSISGPGYLQWLVDQGYALDVLQPDGTRLACAGAADVEAAYEASGVDHIDIVALPV